LRAFAIRFKLGVQAGHDVRVLGKVAVGLLRAVADDVPRRAVIDADVHTRELSVTCGSGLGGIMLCLPRDSVRVLGIGRALPTTTARPSRKVAVLLGCCASELARDRDRDSQPNGPSYARNSSSRLLVSYGAVNSILGGPDTFEWG